MTIVTSVNTKVDRKVRGKAALHVACIDGYVGVLRKLLEYKPDLELLVSLSLRVLEKLVTYNFFAPLPLLRTIMVKVHSTYVPMREFSNTSLLSCQITLCW